MKKIEQNNLYYLIAGLLVLGVAFYWFQVRPSNIRKECANITSDKMKEAPSTGSVDTFKKSYDLIFASCLNKKGLK